VSYNPKPFNIHFISDLLVSTRYHPGLSLAQWFGNAPLCLDEHFLTILCKVVNTSEIMELQM
jgi:hypothetical protein